MRRKKIFMLIGCLSLIVFLTSISLAGAKGPPPHAESWENAAVAQFQVVSPRGEHTVEMITMAPRLEDGLGDKTICLIAGDAFKAEVTFPKIAELLTDEYPLATVVPYTDMPYYKPEFYRSGGCAERDEVRDAILAAGCDAVITGNGG